MEARPLMLIAFRASVPRTESAMTDTFPRQNARTRGFSLGLPRGLAIAPDGSRVAFLRSSAGDDPVSALWVYDVAEDAERVVFDPRTAGEAEGELIGEERDRRERAGEHQTGVVAYATDQALTRAAFLLGDQLHLADLTGKNAPMALPTAGPAFDPRPNHEASHVAYLTGGALHSVDVASGADTVLASDDDPDVRWGMAEFIAAEEMARSRGYWWAPDGRSLLATKVDENALPTWYIGSPVDPRVPPRAIRYAQAGTVNAIVTLHVLGLDGSRVDVDWDREEFEYLVAASWASIAPPLAMVQSRDQRRIQVLAIDPDSGSTQVVWQDSDDVWVEGTPGAPGWAPEGSLVVAAHRDDTRRLLVGGAPVTPPGLQVVSLVDPGAVISFLGTQDPQQVHAWQVVPGDDPVRLSADPGIHSLAVSGDLFVLTSETMASPLPVSTLHSAGAPVHTFGAFPDTPLIKTSPTFFAAGSRALRTAVLTPGSVEPWGSLPVLLDPYAGPHFSRVVSTQRAHLMSQWFADQGFAVVVVDGRGTPNRGIAWEQSVYGDYFDAALEDQIEALRSAAERFPFMDLSKVAIRGWSYGGGLVLAAMLRRPDVFKAGISGAPVTDMRYYDTYYTERYLGHPSSNPDAYEGADLVKDAAGLQGELMILHGVADDNVYFAHSLRMSRALLEAGKRHTMLPLSGITHRTVDELAAENMLLIQVEFLRRALGIASAE
jgi:dipeptidyl-peptidase 4